MNIDTSTGVYRFRKCSQTSFFIWCSFAGSFVKSHQSNQEYRENEEHAVL